VCLLLFLVLLCFLCVPVCPQKMRQCCRFLICKLFGVAVFLVRACLSSENATVLQIFEMQAVWCFAVFLVRACLSSEKATVLQVFDMQAVWCCCVSCACLFVLRKGDGAAGF